MQNFKNKLAARLEQARSIKSPKQGGWIGIILAVVALVVFVGLYFLKSSGETPNADKQKIKMDASTLVNQTSQLRNGLVMMAGNTDLAWTAVANKSGKLSLVNSTQDFTETAKVPKGPVGKDGQPVTWKFISVPQAGFVNPTVYALSSNNVSAEVCQAVNKQSTGVATLPAAEDTAVLDLVVAPAPVMPVGNTAAGLVGIPDLTALEAVLSEANTLCVMPSYDAGVAKYRILTKLMN